MKRIRLLSVFLSFLLIICACNIPKAGKVHSSHEELMKSSSRTEKNGWISVHLEGPPGVIGYQHGYLLEETTYDSTILSTSPNACRLGWHEIIKKNRGLIDVRSAMKFMGDHYDTWRKT